MIEALIEAAKSNAYNQDCMDAMREFPDKHFDLAVVDPPYGIGASEMQMGTGKKKWKKGKGWDSAVPSEGYFAELMRVSKNQIIWGGNHFDLPLVRGWIFWDKDVQPNLSFSSGELAWTSFDMVLKKANIDYSGFRGSDGEKIHPTQKPVALYDWIYKNYLPQGGKVIDTHLGSGSNRIAAHKAGNIEFYGYEIDKDYFEAQEKRFKAHIAQLTIFST